MQAMQVLHETVYAVARQNSVVAVTASNLVFGRLCVFSVLAAKVYNIPLALGGF